MAKKKTSVSLPDGIKGLVHQLQSGPAEPAPAKRYDTPAGTEENRMVVSEHKDVYPEQPTTAQPATTAPAQTEVTPQQAPVAQPAATTQPAAAVQPQSAAAQSQAAAVVSQPSAPVQTDVPVQATAGAPKVETPAIVPAEQEAEESKPARDYHVIKDNSEDSWQLFLDMAQSYKHKTGKLSTIYIDPELKHVLDRLKTSTPGSLSTSAILSSIVARFIYDHEETISKIIFGGKLI